MILRIRYLLLAQTGAVTSCHTSFAGMRQFTGIFDADGSRGICTPTVSGRPARGSHFLVIGTAEPAPTLRFGGGGWRDALCVGVVVVRLFFLLFECPREPGSGFCGGTLGVLR